MSEFDEVEDVSCWLLPLGYPICCCWTVYGEFVDLSRVGLSYELSLTGGDWFTSEPGPRCFILHFSHNFYVDLINFLSKLSI